MSELYDRPSRLGILALVVFGFNLLFHVIAFCTNDWCTFTLDGIQVRLGLWQGCLESSRVSRKICNKEILSSNAINTGTGWHVGTQVMMVFLLILMLVTEFALTGYTCIKKLKPYRKRLGGILLLSTIGHVPMLGIILLMFGAEAAMLKDGVLSWSYGMVVINLCLSIAITVILFLDRFRGKRKQTRSEKYETETSSDRQLSKAIDNQAFSDIDSTEYSGSAYTSEFQLTSQESGTFDKNSATSNDVSMSTFSTDLSSNSQKPNMILEARKDTVDQNFFISNDQKSLTSVNSKIQASKESSRRRSLESSIPEGGMVNKYPSIGSLTYTYLNYLQTSPKDCGIQDHSKSLRSNRLSSSSIESTV